MSDRLFVPASELYDVESQTPIAHPAHQATDADVRRALEDQDRMREIRADGGRHSATIDGTRVPVVQIDRFDDDLILNVNVASAVNNGFDFTGIWQCKRVTVSITGGEFAATIGACSVEHGIAAIQLTDCELFGDDDREHRSDGALSSEGDHCDSCGLAKIGGKCLTRWCDDRHSSVDEVFGGGR